MAVYNVASAAELTSVLSKLTGGDTVLLAGGNYGNLSFYQKNYASTVTFAAAPNTGTVHFDGLNVASSSNLTFKGLDLGRGLKPDEPEYTKLNTVQNSSNVKLINVSIHGSLDGDVTNDGMGLYVTDSKNVEVLNASFNELFRGVLVQRTTNITLGSSRFEGIRSDGANFTGNDQVMVRGNVFKDFNRFGSDHADAIQFWNTGQTKGQSDIVIKDNVFLQQQAGKGAQGIFIYDNEAHKFTNVLIQNNLMYGNDDYNGITVNNGVDVRVIGNTVVSSGLDPKNFWIRLEKSQNVTVRDNVTDDLKLGNDLVGLVNQNNLRLVSDAAARARFLDLDTPSGVTDLILSGQGFQLPDRGAVAKVLGSSLLGAIGQGKGLSASQEEVLSNLDFGSTGEELVFEPARGSAALAPTPVSAALGGLLTSDGSAHAQAGAAELPFAEQPVAAAHGTVERFWTLEHFVALP
jgi:preprotein translocase subunit YajC